MKTFPSITPVILTLNEEPNIERTLNALRWASRVVIVDSGSTDRTAEIAQSFPNVAWHERPFDAHARQWGHAVRETNIDTDWALALDADMVVSTGLIDEMEQQFFPRSYTGGIVSFTYCCCGRDLFGSLYPPDLRVFRPDAVVIKQDGHTQRFSVAGETYRFKTKIVHDDRKPLERWVQGQLNYSLLEQRRMSGASSGSLKSLVRKMGLSPALAGIGAYIRAGGPLKGTAALQYAYERLTFEALLAMRLLREDNSETLSRIHLEKSANISS